MKLRILAALLVFAMAPQAALAEDMSLRDSLHASYSLWGMMDAMAGFCTEKVPGDASVEATYIGWQADNILVEDELELALVVANEPDALADEGRAAGSDGILAIVGPATNPDEVCATWKAKTANGDYDAETFLAEHLAIIREQVDF